MSKDLLWEIGVEEIPARFLESTISQMEELAKDAFNNIGLSYLDMHIYATPRRLVLLVDGIIDKVADFISEVKGPAKRASFDKFGQPTTALEGFCRSQGVKSEQLFEREINGNIYMYAQKKNIGKTTKEVLPKLLLDIGEKLYFPKPMRWGYNTFRFARPIRWMIVLYGEEIIPITFGGIPAGRYSRGHRLLGSDCIEIKEPARYKDSLRVNFVIVDQEERKALCWEQIKKLAASIGGQVIEDNELLSEVTYLLEYPTALYGCFEDKYLAIPEELIITPMVEQQRYFPVYNLEGKLMSRFITVRNGDNRYLNIVAAGNEKVLQARLADAEFFYKEDLKEKMEEKVEELTTVVFHENLGSMRKKVERITQISIFIAKKLGYSEKEIMQIQRAAYLAKADLGSRVVYEFPELQGVIGEYYAREQGEDPAVAMAIREHYLPRFAGDKLPESNIGLVISLADKLDSLVSFFAMGIIPSGSQDPYALRRAASGCVQIIIYHQLDLRIIDFLPYIIDLIRKDAVSYDIEQLEERINNLIIFIIQRVENILDEEGISYDIINAIRETSAARNGEVLGLLERAHALEDFRKNNDLPILAETLSRVININRPLNNIAENINSLIEPKIFTSNIEGILFTQIQNMEKLALPALEKREFRIALKALLDLSSHIDAFFEEVMVMDEDLTIRANRQALLQHIIMIADEIGDFSQIIKE